MASLVHIGEVAALLFVAYQLAWFLGFALRRLVSRPAKLAAVAVEAPPVAKSDTESPVRVPVIAPIATPPAAPSGAAPTPVEVLIANLEPEVSSPAEAAKPAVELDVAPPPVLTAKEADVSPPPEPLSADFFAELQSAMLEEEPEKARAPEDPKTSAALTAAFEEAFDLSDAPPVAEVVEPSVNSAPEPEPNLFDAWTRPRETDVVPEVPVHEAAVPAEIIVAVEAESQEESVTPSEIESEAPSELQIEPVPIPVSLPPDAMPAPPMMPATEPGKLATNARQPAIPPSVVEPVLPPPTAAPTPPPMPASKPGEVWSGIPKKQPARTGILRPTGAPRAPSLGPAAARPSPTQSSPRPVGDAVASAREAVAAAAAKVQQVVAAADYDDGVEASDEDAEAAAMRAIESGWMRKAAPRKSKPDQPEGVPPLTRPKGT